MEAIARFAHRAFLGLLDQKVAPVASAYDENDVSALEEGRQNAATKAAAIRSHLAAAYSDRSDALVAYEAAKSLLTDLWGVIVQDALTAQPSVATWATSAISRAVNKGAAAENFS